MDFDTPMSFAEAVKHLLSKQLMPTALDSAGLRLLDDSIRRQSFFSAQTLSEDLLGRYKTFVGSIIVGFLYNFGQALLPELAYFVLFMPMLLVLLLRPQGLFGRHVP